MSSAVEERACSPPCCENYPSFTPAAHTLTKVTVHENQSESNGCDTSKKTRCKMQPVRMLAVSTVQGRDAMRDGLRVQGDATASDDASSIAENWA